MRHLLHVGATPLAVNVGATCGDAFGFDPVEAWRIIEREKITSELAKVGHAELYVAGTQLSELRSDQL